MMTANRWANIQAHACLWGAVLFSLSSWFAHLAVRLEEGRHFFAIGGALVFPVAVIDGAGLILNWWS